MRIYKLFLTNPDGEIYENYVYYGSTKKEIQQRKKAHIKDFKKWQLYEKHKRLYMTSFELLKKHFENPEIYLLCCEEIENCENLTRREMLNKEKEFINLNKFVNHQFKKPFIDLNPVRV